MYLLQVLLCHLKDLFLLYIKQIRSYSYAGTTWWLNVCIWSFPTPWSSWSSSSSSLVLAMCSTIWRMCCNFIVTGCCGVSSSTLFTRKFIVAAYIVTIELTVWSTAGALAGSTFWVLFFYTPPWVQSIWTVEDTANRTL